MIKRFGTIMTMTLTAMMIGCRNGSLTGSKEKQPTVITLEIIDTGKAVLAQTSAPVTGADQTAELHVDHVYQPGDRIRVAGRKYLVVKLDDHTPESLVYLPSSGGEYIIPHEDPNFLISYAPESFKGQVHTIIVRLAREDELTTYRNVAYNPYALRNHVFAYPYASTNNEYDNGKWSCCYAKNALDGIKENVGHGIWPYQSWGPDRRTDLWWQVDFGRSVEVDKVNLWIRSDFPHDNYWHSAVMEFSDGSREKIKIEKTHEMQSFSFDKRVVQWVRLTDLVQSEPLGWCALTEVEIWGRDVMQAEPR